MSSHEKASHGASIENPLITPFMVDKYKSIAEDLIGFIGSVVVPEQGSSNVKAAPDPHKKAAAAHH